MTKLLTDAQKEELRAFLPDYLAKHGIQLQKGKNISCIFHDHKDSNPSMSYKESEHYLYCFGCERWADIFTACEELENLPKGQGINRIKELYGVSQHTLISHNTYKNGQLGAGKETGAGITKSRKDYTTFVESSYLNLSKCSYHAERGISEEIAKRFKLGYAFHFKGMDTALVIPMQREDGTYSYQLRNTSKDESAQRHYKPSTEEAGEAELFNANAIKQLKPVAIVEGAIDALSIMTAGMEAIALNGAQNKAKLYKLINTHKNHLPPIILALDNDEAGRRAQREIQAELSKIRTQEGHKLAVYELNLSHTFKDANEALQANPEQFKRQFKDLDSEEKIRATQYRQQTSIQQINDFYRFVKEEKKPAISTGFTGIDRILNGGLREGLYCIGAISSLGKTTLALQIMDNIAKKGRDVLIFSLEMSGNELRAKSVSRESALISLAKTSFYSRASTALEVQDSDLLKSKDEEAKEVLNGALQTYYKYAGNVFIKEAVGRFNVNDIKAIVKHHVNMTGKTPVILVDYLQILQTSDPRLSDKQKVSYDVLTLKQISRDFKTPVVVISSFNRESYSRQATFASFKESGDIEYSADALIALQLSVLKEQPAGIDISQRIEEALNEAPRRVDVCFIKNRYGVTDYCQLQASLAFNLFQESAPETRPFLRRKNKKV